MVIDNNVVAGFVMGLHCNCQLSCHNLLLAFENRVRGHFTDDLHRGQDYNGSHIGNLQIKRDCWDLYTDYVYCRNVII